MDGSPRPHQKQRSEIKKKIASDCGGSAIGSRRLQPALFKNQTPETVGTMVKE
jgi:hypothetical protein